MELLVITNARRDGFAVATRRLEAGIEHSGARRLVEAMTRGLDDLGLEHATLLVDGESESDSGLQPGRARLRGILRLHGAQEPRGLDLIGLLVGSARLRSIPGSRRFSVSAPRRVEENEGAKARAEQRR